MSDDKEGIKFSAFQVKAINFQGNGFPKSVNLASYYFANVSDQNISPVELSANLTQDEATALMKVLNNIAARVEEEIREGLEEHRK